MLVVNRLERRGSIKKDIPTNALDTTHSVLEIVKKIISELSKKQTVMDKLATDSEDYIREEIDRVITDFNFSVPGHSREELLKQVFDFMFKYSIIQKFIDMPSCNNIKINAYDNIWIQVDNERIETDLSFGSEEYLMIFIHAIRAKLGGKLDYNNSLGKFTDKKYKLRIIMAIAPIASGSPIISIRKQPKEDYSLSQLIDLKMMTPEEADFLVIEANNKKNIVFCGKGGSGKTTCMRAIIEELKREYNILIMEELEELYVKHPNANSFLVRRDKGRYYGIGDFTDIGLLMNIDYYIFGETRKAEALELFQGAYNGNCTFTTTHSSSTANAMEKLMINMEGAGTSIPAHVLKEMLYKSIDYIVYLDEFKIKSIGVVDGFEVKEIYPKEKIEVVEHDQVG